MEGLWRGDGDTLSSPGRLAYGMKRNFEEEVNSYGTSFTIIGIHLNAYSEGGNTRNAVIKAIAKVTARRKRGLFGRSLPDVSSRYITLRESSYLVQSAFFQ